MPLLRSIALGGGSVARVKDGRVTGVRTQTDQVFNAPCVILTSGTFMNGTIHIGERQFGGGRMGERASVGGRLEEARS